MLAANNAPTALPTSSRSGRNQFSRKRTSPAVDAGTVPITAVFTAPPLRASTDSCSDTLERNCGSAIPAASSPSSPEVALRVSTKANTRENWPT